jgi:hypothetical protein
VIDRDEFARDMILQAFRAGCAVGAASAGFDMGHVDESRPLLLYLDSSANTVLRCCDEINQQHPEWKPFAGDDELAYLIEMKQIVREKLRSLESP